VVGCLPNLLGAWIASAFRKHAAAIDQYEKCIARAPLFAPFLWGQAKAFEQLGKEDLAIVTLEFLRQNRPDHVASLRELAHIYEKRRDIPRAMQRYRLILQTKPHDLEANKQLHDLAATESIQENWDKDDTFHEKIRDKEKAVRLEQGQRIVRTVNEATDAVARLKAEIDEDPEKSTLWTELGDLERKKGDLDAAIAAYNKARELDPLNQLYLQKLMDAQLQQYEARVSLAREEANRAPGDKALQDKVTELDNQKKAFWLAELRRRVDERPTETSLRFSLGQLYFEIGRTNEAIAEFQRVVRDVKYRLQSTAMLGKCFAIKGLDELAVSQLEKALAEANLLEEMGKDIAYTLGGLYEKMGNFAAAEETYKKIFELDIGYLDIAEKMESIYRKRREKNPLPNQGGTE
jgi:tetratricopeptide (TPR) repeat protein